MKIQLAPILKTLKSNYILTGGILLALVAVFVFWRFFLFSVAKDNEQKIRQLHPKLRNKARRFLTMAKRQGLDLKITESTRTWQRQAELYAQGRTTPGQIVTNAKPGTSFHNYGLAFDVIDRKTGYNADWQKIGKIGKNAGFEWGGSWTSFVDRPHFQDKLGYTISELQKLYNAGKWKN
jgi:peptidoglycan LD-endopeptidase CwlK